MAGAGTTGSTPRATGSASGATPSGVTLTVRLKPRAGADRILGRGRDEAGRPYLSVSVTAAPVDGAANTALIRLLAKQLGLPKSAVTLASGASARVKRLSLAGDAAAIEARLAALEEAS